MVYAEASLSCGLFVVENRLMKRELKCFSAPRQHLIDHVQKTLPSIPVGNGEPLEHHQAVKMLGEHWVANVLRQPLMHFVAAMALVVPRAFPLEFLQKTRSQAFKNKVVGVVADHAIPVLR